MLEDKDLISIQEVRTKVEKAYAAWQKYRTFSQEQVDAIVERMAAAARANAKRLADMAVEETGYGNAKDKYVKNLLCCDWLPRRMRGMKTVGVLREIPEERMVEIGVPVGVVAAILPTTNPTSTAIYKTLVSLKAGNAIVISPHPRAHQCTCDDRRDAVPGRRRSRRARRYHPVRGQRHARRHQRADAARAHRRDSFHRRRGHRQGRLFQRQAGLRRGPRQRARAGGSFGRSRGRHRQDRRRQILRLRHGMLQRAGDCRRSIRCATASWPCSNPSTPTSATTPRKKPWASC